MAGIVLRRYVVGMKACPKSFKSKRALVAHGSCSPLSLSCEAPSSAFVAVWHFYWALCCCSLACPCHTPNYIWGSGGNISICVKAAEWSCPRVIPRCCCQGAGRWECWGSQGSSDVPEAALGMLMAWYPKVPSSCMECWRWCCSPWETPQNPRGCPSLVMYGRLLEWNAVGSAVSPWISVCQERTWRVLLHEVSELSAAKSAIVLIKQKHPKEPAGMFWSGTEMLLIMTCPWPNCTASSLAPVPWLEGTGFWKPSILWLSWKMHTFLMRVLLLCVAAPQEGSIPF